MWSRVRGRRCSRMALFLMRCKFRLVWARSGPLEVIMRHNNLRPQQTLSEYSAQGQSLTQLLMFAITSSKQLATHSTHSTNKHMQKMQKKFQENATMCEGSTDLQKNMKASMSLDNMWILQCFLGQKTQQTNATTKYNRPQAPVRRSLLDRSLWQLYVTSCQNFILITLKSRCLISGDHKVYQIRSPILSEIILSQSDALH